MSAIYSSSCWIVNYGGSWVRTDIALQSSFYALGKSPGWNLLTYIIHYQPPLPLCFIKRALVFIIALYFCQQRRDGFKRTKVGRYMWTIVPPVGQITLERTGAQINGEDRWFANLTVLSLNLCVINLCSLGTYYSKLDDGIDRHKLSMKAAREQVFDLFIWS